MCSAFVRAEHVGDDKLGTPERTPAADDELRVGDRQHPEEEVAALGRGVLREPRTPVRSVEGQRAAPQRRRSSLTAAGLPTRQQVRPYCLWLCCASLLLAGAADCRLEREVARGGRGGLNELQLHTL